MRAPAEAGARSRCGPSHPDARTGRRSERRHGARLAEEEHGVELRLRSCIVAGLVVGQAQGFAGGVAQQPPDLRPQHIDLGGRVALAAEVALQGGPAVREEARHAGLVEAEQGEHRVQLVEDGVLLPAAVDAALDHDYAPLKRLAARARLFQAAGQLGAEHTVVGVGDAPIGAALTVVSGSW